jgi:hypothetical protein
LPNEPGILLRLVRRFVKVSPINLTLTVDRYADWEQQSLSLAESAFPKSRSWTLSRLLLHPLFGLMLIAVSLPICLAQANEGGMKAAEPMNVAGKWEMSWTGRLGTEKCTLELQQDTTKVKGTFQDLRGNSSLSGTIDGNKISFEVEFKGPKPFTTRFTGNIADGKITGTSQAVGVGGSGAYLGHAGEIVQPEHPWTATRAKDQPNPSAAAKSPDSPARN